MSWVLMIVFALVHVPELTGVAYVRSDAPAFLLSEDCETSDECAGSTDEMIGAQVLSARGVGIFAPVSAIAPFKSVVALSPDLAARDDWVLLEADGEEVALRRSIRGWVVGRGENHADTIGGVWHFERDLIAVSLPVPVETWSLQHQSGVIPANGVANVAWSPGPISQLSSLVGQLAALFLIASIGFFSCSVSALEVTAVALARFLGAALVAFWIRGPMLATYGRMLKNVDGYPVGVAAGILVGGLVIAALASAGVGRWARRTMRRLLGTEGELQPSLALSCRVLNGALLAGLTLLSVGLLDSLLGQVLLGLELAA